MKINFESANCNAEWMHEKRYKLFENIVKNDTRFPKNKSLRTSRWVYFSGVDAGFRCSVFTLAGRVSAVIEALFKVLGNIFGAPVSNNCSAKTGFKQLTADLPLSVLKLIFVMPIEILRDLVATPVCVAFDKRYALSQMGFELSMYGDVSDIGKASALGEGGANGPYSDTSERYIEIIDQDFSDENNGLNNPFFRN